MARWPAVKANRLYAALARIGWVEVRRAGSHRRLERDGKAVTVAFHEGEEIGPKILAKIAKVTGLKPEDL